jgi:hypothetical protein
VSLLETLLKVVCRKIQYDFPFGSDNFLSQLKSTPMWRFFQAGKGKEITWF